MKTIFKYKLGADYKQIINLSKGAVILTVQVQNREAYIWALIDTSIKEITPRTIHVYGTGHQMHPDTGRYIGTVLLADGNLVFHIFEGK